MTSHIPHIPETAPFTAAQRTWLNGYLAGLFSNTSGTGGDSSQVAPRPPLLVLYGSQTGTSEQLAKKLAKDAQGFAARAVCMEQFESIEWAKEPNVLVITSTYGDGEPPDNAQAFWAWLSSDAAPRLETTQFSVLALGDTNYPEFCAFGKKCDTRLAELCAKRIADRVDCDLEYEESAAAWTTAVFNALAAVAATPSGSGAPAQAAPAPTGYGKKNPFPAKLLANVKLTGDGSGKEVRHFEIALEGSGLTYEVGDALGVWPTNCPAVVDTILGSLGCDGEEAVQVTGLGEVPLRLALAKHFDVTKPSNDLLKAAACRAPGSELAALLAPEKKDALKIWLWGREVSDVLALATTPFAPDELLALLRKLAPRLYSISSSPNAHPGEVHLTVGAVRYESHGIKRGGVCSTFLADRAGDNVPVFVQPSHGFKQPEKTGTPIIMVGPGTGIAPFRAFLEERLVSGANGKNWLFFGDQRRATDFLYEETLTGWQKDGHLTRLDLAFSRDQVEKIYVQHRMLEASAELWAWLEEGAHFYVCGDASRMAKDVDAALHKVIEQSGGKTADEAAAYVAKLKSDKRYQRDVY